MVPVDDAPCYLNGEWLALADARISPLDRGFLFGDGVYEVIPAYGGHAFLRERHLRRLADSLAAIGLEGLGTDPGAVVDGLLADTSDDCAVYLQVTRGVAPQRDHRFPRATEPCVFGYRLPVATPAGIDTEGVAVILREDLRWQRCDIKATSLLGNVLLRQAAEAEGAAETVLHRDGRVTEASASNLFAVIDGVVITPPLGPDLLAGVTRGLVLELLADQGLPSRVRALSAAELAGAEELWLSSSTKEVVPVTAVDGRAVGSGRPGPVWRGLRAAFDRCKARFRERCAAETGA